MKNMELKTGKRFLAIILVMFLLVSMMPLPSATAVEGGGQAGIQKDTNPVLEDPGVDKAALAQAIAAAEVLKEEDYTKDSWANLQTALTAAKAVYADEEADQATVDTATSNLNDAIEALVKNEDPTPEVDKTALKSAIEAAKQLNEEEYTANSWASLQTALSEAETVYADEEADQAAVDTATSNLNAAIEALVKNEDPTPEVDKTALKSAIEAAKQLNEEEYTANSWASLQTALSEAETVYADEEADQAAVDTATSNLNAAIEALVKVYTVTLIQPEEEAGFATINDGTETLTVASGDKVTLKATANEHYHIDSITVKLSDGTEKELEISDSNSFEGEIEVTDDMKIIVTISIDMLTVKVSTSDKDHVSVEYSLGENESKPFPENGLLEIPYHTAVSLKLTIKEGYSLERVTLNQADIEVDSNTGIADLGNVDQDLDVVITIKKDQENEGTLVDGFSTEHIIVKFYKKAGQDAETEWEEITTPITAVDSIDNNTDHPARGIVILPAGAKAELTPNNPYKYIGENLKQNFWGSYSFTNKTLSITSNRPYNFAIQLAKRANGAGYLSETVPYYLIFDESAPNAAFSEKQIYKQADTFRLSIQEDEATIDKEAIPNAFAGIEKVEYYIVAKQDASSADEEIPGDEATEESETEINWLIADLVDSDGNPVSVSDGIGKATAEIPLTGLEDGDYIVHIRTTDRVGNVSDDTTANIVVDSTLPEIIVKTDGSTYYTTAIELIVQVKDNNIDSDKVMKALLAGIAATDANGVKAENIIDNPTVSIEADVYSYTFTLPVNYKYELAFKCQDEAGNEGNAEPCEFIIDAEAPSGTIKLNEEKTWDALFDSLTLGLLYKKTAKVTVAAEDNFGVSSVKYVKVHEADARTLVNALEAQRDKAAKVQYITNWAEKQTWTMLNTAGGDISIDKNEAFIVIVQIVDNAGLKTFISSGDLLVLDNVVPETNIEINLSVSDRKEIYSGNVPVRVSVVDQNEEASGILEVYYQIKANDIGREEKGKVSLTDNVNYLGGGRIRSGSGTITVNSNTFNSNEVVVEAWAVDNSKNESVHKSIALKIDVTKPIISITPAAITGYQNQPQSFTITVQERNFAADKFVLNIAATDGGVAPVLSGWSTPSAKNGNGDNITHSATLTFARDGVYSFTVDDTDSAGNKADQKRAGEFTIDLTAPVITVSYDNNNAANDRYFNAARTATVTITEHNFDPSRVIFTPAQNVTWNNNGDTHTATISYATDGDYTFDVTATDLANNNSEPVNYGSSVAPTDFTVDMTFEDMVTISAVEDGKAYSYEDVVIPDVLIEDTNFDTYEVTLVGLQRGNTVDLTEEVNKLIEENENGITALFDVFHKTADFDGIYTLYVKGVDLAGNVDEEQIRFTVNRFGSVYEYSDALMDLIENGGTYNQSIDEDLTFTIYNASPIDPSNVSVVITRDGRPVEAIFTVVETTADGDGWYSYLVTIDKSNFAEDGVYTVSVTTTDDAKNTVENTGDNSDGDILFYVDSTAPQLTSVSGLEERIVNATELEVSYTVYDTIGLASVQVKVDGEIVDTATDFDDASNYSGKFTIYEKSSEQHVSFVLTDKAGNVTESDAAGFEVPYTLEKDVTVSTNLFVRWFANKPLFFGGIGGGIAVLGGLGALLGLKKKKKVKVS